MDAWGIGNEWNVQGTRLCAQVAQDCYHVIHNDDSKLAAYAREEPHERGSGIVNFYLVLDKRTGLMMEITDEGGGPDAHGLPLENRAPPSLIFSHCTQTQAKPGGNSGDNPGEVGR
jgi:hypothetical protein